MNLNLTDAYHRFGAKPGHRLRCLSAIAADGAVVLTCAQSYFGHPARGVLRYEDRLSRESQHPKDVLLLGQHLTLARSDDLPVRMVVACAADPNCSVVSGYHVRPDLIGKVMLFDGDHFMIDFTRCVRADAEVPKGRGKPRRIQ